MGYYSHHEAAEVEERNDREWIDVNNERWNKGRAPHRPEPQDANLTASATIAEIPDAAPAPAPKQDDGWQVTLDPVTLDPVTLIAGTVTVEFRNPAGRVIAYRFRRVADDRGLTYFVDVDLSRESHKRDWRYLGIFCPDAPNDAKILVTTARSVAKAPNDPAVYAFRKLVTQLVYGCPLDGGYSLRLSGSCPVCGRKLTSDGSLAAGIGPVCRERVYSRLTADLTF